MASPSPVQFRGLCSHYRPGDSLRVSYTYPPDSFSPKAGDQVGVFLAGNPLVLAYTEDPTTHQLCEDTLHKAGRVVLKLPPQSEGEKCELRYVSGGSVLGRSLSFSVSVGHSTTPPGPLGPVGDLTQSCAGSYVDVGSLHSCTGSYIDAGEVFKLECHNSDSSFVVVSEDDSLEPPLLPPGSDYVVGSLEMAATGPLPVPITPSTPSTSSTTTPAPPPHSTPRSNVMSGSDVARGSAVTRADVSTTVTAADSDALSKLKILKAKAADRGSDVTSWLVTQDPNTAKVAQPSKASNENLSPPHGQTLEPNSTTTKRSHVVPTSDAIELVSPYPDLSSSSSGTSDLPPPEVTDMSGSTVMVERHVTQREARALRTSNRDLRSKLHKLSQILETKKDAAERLSETEARLSQQEQASAGAKAELEREVTALKLRLEEGERESKGAKTELEREVSSLKRRLKEKEREMQEKVRTLVEQLRTSEDARHKTESLGKKLIVERSSLEEKVRVLTREKQATFDRCLKLLTQLRESETKREVEKSEKQVLQGKIDYLVGELRKLKDSQQKNDYDTHRASTRTSNDPRKQGGRGNAPGPGPNDTREGANSKRPADLPLGLGGGGGGASNHRYHRHGDGIGGGGGGVQGGRKNEPPRHERVVASAQGGAKQKPRGEQVVKRGGGGLTSGYGRANGIGSVGRTEGGVGGSDAYQTLKEDEVRSKLVIGRDQEHQTLSEERIGIIADQMKREVGRAGAGGREGGEGEGEGWTMVVECPICGKVLHARENDYAVMLHVEHCIQLSEIDDSK